MPKLPRLTAREICSVLEKLGFPSHDPEKHHAGRGFERRRPGKTAVTARHWGRDDRRNEKAAGTTEVVRLHGKKGTMHRGATRRKAHKLRRATARGRGGPRKLRAQQ